MTKYSFEEKLEAVLRVLNDGMSPASSARILGAGTEHVRRWVNFYEEHGADGLTMKHGTYTGKFKVYAVEYMHIKDARADGTVVLHQDRTAPFMGADRLVHVCHDLLGAVSSVGAAGNGKGRLDVPAADREGGGVGLMGVNHKVHIGSCPVDGGVDALLTGGL